ncbi:MAG: uracil-DNA glycosylase family protein [Parasphingorhabdus sp.]|uniref:uracil-DNA glycosylase family protein n=1 Tax=Parasphingorhabdus sp. TaxID=2709688 RepID=UPI00300394EC
MNFSTSAHFNSPSVEQIESLRDWWALAGVDLHYKSDIASLLSEAAPVIRTTEPKPAEVTTASVSQAKSAPVSAPLQTFNENYPANHDDYRGWLSKPENLIEAQWSKNHVLPTGMIEPQTMIIVGMPEQSGFVRNSLFAEQTSALLANMLKAIGYDSEKTYFAAISLGRTVDGRIDQQYHETLKNRMLHHIGLVQPKKILIFGDTPSRLLLGQNLLTARKNKQFINHLSSKIDAVVTFHPRILIERPEFKAEAWKDLQLFTRTSKI